MAQGLVEWWGRRDDMPLVLSQSALVCLPSYREGLPKALLEAASCGRAIVTSDVPGCREIVQNGENGLLVPAGDAMALAGALAFLLQDRRATTYGRTRPRQGTRGIQSGVGEPGHHCRLSRVVGRRCRPVVQIRRHERFLAPNRRTDWW